MRKLSTKERATLKYQKRLRLGPSLGIRAIQDLKIGECLLITFGEWRLQTTPQERIGSDAHNPRSVLWKRRFTTATLASGWLVERVK